MPTQIEFPDEPRRAIQSTLQGAIQSMNSVQNKKRKRHATEHTNNHDEDMASSPKRGSLTSITGNSSHAALNVPQSTDSNFADSSEFSDLHRQLSQANATSDHTSTAAAALAAHNYGNTSSENGPSLSFMSSDSDRQLDSSFGMSGGGSGSGGGGNNNSGATGNGSIGLDGHNGTSHHHNNQPYNLAPFANVSGSPQMSVGSTAAAVQAAREANGGHHNKPAVGTDEWHKVRRDNHKEVERRRRETINEGINELAKIVPGSEKNKGSILARAVTYINDLKQIEEQTVEKRTVEQLVLQQAVEELSKQNEHLKAELKRAWGAVEELRSGNGTGKKAKRTANANSNGDADAEVASSSESAVAATAGGGDGKKSGNNSGRSGDAEEEDEDENSAGADDTAIPLVEEEREASL